MAWATSCFICSRRARIPAEVWHLKTAYQANWGKMTDVLARFEAARARGLDVSAHGSDSIRNLIMDVAPSQHPLTLLGHPTPV